MTKGAYFSKCKKYRYVLYRVWDESKPQAMCIGLNPSTANAETNDPTINNLITILSSLGFGGLYMTNLFAFISSNPDDLRKCPDPVKENDKYLGITFLKCDKVIFCWGNFKQAVYRAKVVEKMFYPLGNCFGKNKNGTPMHPLALMYNGTVKQPSLIPYDSQLQNT